MAAIDPIKKAAVYAMSLADNADDVARVADDWGWKGGKPGEITGGIYNELYGKMGGYGRLQSTDGLSEDAVRLITTSPLSRDLTKSLSLDNAAISQLKNSPINAGTPNIGRVMDDFALLENADIPREWTGKIVSAFGGRVPRNGAEGVDRLIGDIPVGRGTTSYRDIVATKVSDIMRPMTNDQRETFLALLPEWSGSLDELADAARSL
jgi:hypothetical protein